MKKYLFLYCMYFLAACQSNRIRPDDLPAGEAIRGVWVPAPRFTPVLASYDHVKNFVALLDSLHMNAIFLDAYAETKTIFKSEVLHRYSTYADPEAGWLLRTSAAGYRSPTGDPVRDLLDEAHRSGIRVFFWFEYGFMGDGRPLTTDNPLTGRHPDWIAYGNDRQPAHYNRHDYYFNAYRPEVQDFLLELVAEAFDLYPDLDGIQGDDRLPAMPRNSGYDAYTTEQYRKEHAGKNPPDDYNDPEWVRWRLDLLNTFAGRLYRTVKEKSPEAWVSFAPNPYPWCEENLMQEWPAWCRDGHCDLLAVQCYRYSAEAYRSTLDGVLGQLKKISRVPHFAPGIILMEGGTGRMTPELLERQLHANRQRGIRSEIFFYNEALEDPAVRQILEREYRKKIRFPDLPGPK